MSRRCRKCGGEPTLAAVADMAAEIADPILERTFEIMGFVRSRRR